MSEEAARIASSVARNVNLAFYQNAIPLVRELSVSSDRDLAAIEIHLSSEPAFITPGVWRVERIAAGDTHHVKTLDLKLNHGFLAGLTAARRGEIIIRVDAGGETCGSDSVEVNLLPPSHWGGAEAAPELLAAFVRPTDPGVDIVLRKAADKLTKAGRDPALNGYASAKKARAWEIGEAIFAALVDHAIAYVLPPKSFERHGQPVRGPSDILGRKVGTCLDLALLYAACLEQAGLNALVVLTEGHAFAGFWLKDEDFSTPVIDDAQMLRKRLQLDEIVLVEMTALTGASPARFRQAVALGARHVAEDAPAPFEAAIDVKRARAAHIRPLDTGDANERPGLDVGPVTAVAPGELEDAPSFEEDMDRNAPAPQRVLDRLEKWKASLLDLSLRNKLLNFKPGKATIGLECGDPARLEDLLASGRRFKLLGRTKVLDGSDGRDPALLRERMNEDARRDYIAQAMARDELFAETPEDELEGRLTDLYRATRLAFEEGGANVLYLCLGFLKWTPQNGAGAYRAPLVLVPVQLERKSVRSGFRLALHEDEVRFNPTLQQMLRADFGLIMPELEGDLPADKSGIDLAGIWKIVRQHVKELKGWEVDEQVVLTTLSFTKYLMWKDLVDRTDVLKRSRVVRHLIDTPTHAYEGHGGEFIQPERLDTDIDPSDLFAPLSADSSQLAAVVAAQRNKDFVLFGPPGTGKTQTITNMIANLLAHGKTVLFVSQKTAALEVARRRLQEVGLGAYCLECHSTKAQKSSVIGQLADSWRNRATSGEENWSLATGELRKRRDELNQLVSALHRRRTNGMSAYEAFGRVVADRGRLPEAGLAWPAGAVHSADDLASMRNTCGDLRTALQAIGNPATHPLRGVMQTRWSPAWRKSMEDAAARLKAALKDVSDCAERFADEIGLLRESWDLADLTALAEFGALLFDPAAADGALLLGDDAGERVRVLRAGAQAIARCAAKRAELSTDYKLQALKLDLAQAQRDWAEACGSNFLLRNGRKNKVRLRLQPYSPGPAPDDIGRDLTILQELQTLVAEVESYAPKFAGMEQVWSGLETDLSRFEPAIAWSTKARAAAEALGQRQDASAALLQHMAGLLTKRAHRFALGGAASSSRQTLADAIAELRDAASAMGGCIGLANPLDLLDMRPGWIADLDATLDRWTANLIKAPAWTHWRAAVSAAGAAGLAPLAAAIEAGDIAPDQIAPTFEYAYASWCAAEIVNTDETLSAFLAERHESAIEAFLEIDERVADLSRQIVRARIGGGVPTITNFGKDPEWGALAHEVNKKARHLPLRQLFGKIPSVLTKLAPCVMMSPLSIAQYLPPDSKPFDVVIFDEASQMPVWDAIGAIARGAQVVVVGDPEQLPPTSVGQRAADGDEDDYDVVQTQESILDECLAANIPSMRLTWHYRSRHESLIAFSNAKYYRGELVTFPSPVTKDDAVRLVHVENGVYDRGKSKTNRIEADALVAEVVRRMRHSRDSIGVVTFNAEQQKLIENLLDQARRSDPSLERHFDKTQTNEPVLVKNLENVQGDERDVIHFSPGVGRDSAGRITAQISSLNGDGGHRRLNVAVTRARKELLVFSSLHPSEVDLGRSGARGVIDYKHFLEFADKGARALAEAFAPSGRETESPFEEAVKRGLEAKGWSVHPQIGVSFFRIDLGIVHPDAPGRYLAGIEADGATYHRSATARDRDALRQRVLEGLGWRIRRVWSTDWWMDPGNALDRIHARLTMDLEEDRAAAIAAAAEAAAAEPPAIPELSASPAEVEESVADAAEGSAAVAAASETTKPSETGAPETVYAGKIHAPASDTKSAAIYVVADPAAAAAPDRERFYDPGYCGELRRMIDHVVQTEAPIYFDILVDRIARAHGFQRAKDNIRGTIRSALDTDRFPLTEDGDRLVVWPQGWTEANLPPWRDGAGRAHADVPLPELASLAGRLAEDGLDDEELLRAIQEHFGLGRLAASTRDRFAAAIALLKQAG